MGKKKQDSMQALRNEMEIFVREVFSGKYDEHPEVKGKPVLNNKFLISEIKRRHPGFKDDAYAKEFSVAYRCNR